MYALTLMLSQVRVHNEIVEEESLRHDRYRV
jgi:hypothetical protein